MSDEQERSKMALRSTNALMVALACGALACDRPVKPRFPDGAVELAPPAQFALWWEVTKQCSGLSSVDTSTIKWFVVPGVDEFEVGEERAAGLWWPDGNRIVLAEAFVNDGPLVRHEMLHAMGRFTRHPPTFYREKCGGVVSCGGQECLKEAGPLPGPPANAERLVAGNLLLSVAVTPTEYTTFNGGWVVITVSVTNPRSVPVWVSLTRPASAPSAETYGFQLDPSFSGTQVTADTQMGFAPNETKRFSFDLQVGVLGGIARGSHAIRGSFNGATTQTVYLSVP